MIAVTLFVLTVLGFILIRRNTPVRTVCPGVLIILAYAVVVLTIYGISLSHYGDEATNAVRTRAFIFLLANGGVALYAMKRVINYEQRFKLLGWLAVGLTFNCLVGLLQNLTPIDLHLLFQPPGFVVNKLSEGLAQTPGLDERFGAKRAFGTSAHAIEFSVLSSVSVLLNVYFLRAAKSRNFRLLAATGLLVALLAVPAGVSRSGVIALAAGFFFYMWNLSLGGLSVAFGLAGLAIVAEGLFSGNFDALWQSISGASDDSSVQVRLNDYAVVTNVFHTQPVFGAGMGVTPPGGRGIFDNQWLTTFVEGGLVDVAGLILLVVGGLFGIAAALRRARTAAERDQAYLLGAIFIAIFATSVTFDLFAFAQATFVFFLAYGLLWSTVSIPIPEPRYSG
ncbi:polymerase [Mycobacterium sp. OTB74]|jgi:O-antigen ligase|uniref:O-antigen ligase family protein n=1 Tax=Mycobacterium sp. OTB74 TaxID=1853452 RepID=UPI0024748DB6|nr:polymerase [Mycobacterium sp. OTB74]